MSYGITSTDGAIGGISGGAWTDTVQGSTFTLARGETRSYSRVLVVGDRGDTQSVLTEIARASGGEAHDVVFTFRDANGPAAIDVGTRVVLGNEKGEPVATVAATGRGDRIAHALLPAKYTVLGVTGGGRKLDGSGATFDVSRIGEHGGGPEVRTVDVAVTLPATLHGRCVMGKAPSRDPKTATKDAEVTPCKVTLQGVEGTDSPNFGPSHVAGPAKNVITVGRAAFDVPLAPGRYRATCSRGPEYSAPSEVVTLRAGETTDLACALRRVVDTRGYLGTDFHQHTMLGADAPVAKRDRVIANVAEGVEVAVATEHNVVADLGPFVRELDLAKELVAIPGNEVTTDASRKPWGHANVFPLVPAPDAPRAGAFVTRDRTAADVIAEARKIAGPLLVQINHPRTELTGYFDQSKFDATKGEGTEPGYTTDFDALEVWNGRNVKERTAVLADYFALLRTGHPTTLTGDTDTHGIVGQEAGYPRTYVRVAHDGNLDAWNRDRSAELVAGVKVLRDTFATNGPMLHVRVNGAPVGGIAKATPTTEKGKRRVVARVHVDCAPWMSVDTVALDFAQGGHEERPVALKPSLGGALGGDVEIEAVVSQDDAMVVSARGAKPLEPVLSGDPAEILPFALTSAVWIDADGDGKALGRERELPTTKGPETRR
ncbi:MAG: CehA/McbA family metallohydrolase [Polyangiaceae bacterium]